VDIVVQKNILKIILQLDPNYHAGVFQQSSMTHHYIKAIKPSLTKEVKNV
jgi:hypothetical protein